MMRRLLALAIAGGAGTALVRSILVPWMRRWGRRPADDGPLPGDEVVADPTAIETRGIDIAAPPEAVWPWLVQMGYGRAGWYSYDALDMNQPSADRIRPELATLSVDDVMPTHPGGGFVVRILDAPRALVLFSDTDLVRRQADAAKADATTASPVNLQATGAFLEAAQPADYSASWAFVLQPTSDGGTRLVERFRVRFGASDKPWLGLTMPVMGVGVFLMMRKQLLGIRDRVERASPTAPVVDAPVVDAPGADAEPASPLAGAIA